MAIFGALRARVDQKFPHIRFAHATAPRPDRELLAVAWVTSVIPAENEPPEAIAWIMRQLARPDKVPATLWPDSFKFSSPLERRSSEPRQLPLCLRRGGRTRLAGLDGCRALGKVLAR